MTAADHALEASDIRRLVLERLCFIVPAIDLELQVRDLRFRKEIKEEQILGGRLVSMAQENLERGHDERYARGSGGGSESAGTMSIASVMIVSTPHAASSATRAGSFGV